MENQIEHEQKSGKPQAAANNETPETEADELMPLASGLGQRSTKTARILGKMNRWFGVADDSAAKDSTSEEAEEAEEAPATAPSNNDSRPKAAGNFFRPATQRDLSRGIITSLVLLLIFLPLTGFLAYLYYDSTLQVDTLQQNLKNFSRTASPNELGQFFAILSEPKVQIKPFNSEDSSDSGRFILFVASRLRWAISYGKLEPLENQMYVVWLVPKLRPNQPASFDRLLVVPDIRSGGGAIVLKEADFPPSFIVSAYSELIITIEPVDKEPKVPTGPRRFSLDLSQILT